MLADLPGMMLKAGQAYFRHWPIAMVSDMWFELEREIEVRTLRHKDIALSNSAYHLKY